MIFKFLFLVFVILSVSGCSFFGKSDNEIEPSMKRVCEEKGTPAPDWVCVVPNYGNIYTAVASASNISDATDEAKERLLSNIFEDIKYKLELFYMMSNIGTIEDTQKVFRNTNRELRSLVMSSSRVMKSSDAGSSSVLIGLSKRSVSKLVKNSVNNYYNSNANLKLMFNSKNINSIEILNQVLDL